jgi:hypothetical protein
VPGSPSSKSETTSKLSLYTFVPSISKRICQIHSVKISMTQSRKQECKKIGGYETSPFCIKPDLQAGDPRTHFLTVTALSTACCRIVLHLKAIQCQLNKNHLDSQLSGRDICKTQRLRTTSKVIPTPIRFGLTISLSLDEPTSRSNEMAISRVSSMFGTELMHTTVYVSIRHHTSKLKER